MAMQESGALKDMWHDSVFINRQKELRGLSNDFSTLLDQMLVDRPLTLDEKLLQELAEEEEEVEEHHEEEQDIEVTIHEQALLLMHEIDQMRKDTYKIITWFRPAVCKTSPRLRSMKQGVEQLHDFLEKLRVRAENLLADD